LLHIFLLTDSLIGRNPGMFEVDGVVLWCSMLPHVATGASSVKVPSCATVASLAAICSICKKLDKSPPGTI